MIELFNSLVPCKKCGYFLHTREAITAGKSFVDRICPRCGAIPSLWAFLARRRGTSLPLLFKAIAGNVVTLDKIIHTLEDRMDHCRGQLQILRYQAEKVLRALEFPEIKIPLDVRYFDRTHIFQDPELEKLSPSLYRFEKRFSRLRQKKYPSFLWFAHLQETIREGLTLAEQYAELEEHRYMPFYVPLKELLSSMPVDAIMARNRQRYPNHEDLEKTILETKKFYQRHFAKLHRQYWEVQELLMKNHLSGFLSAMQVPKQSNKALRKGLESMEGQIEKLQTALKEAESLEISFRSSLIERLIAAHELVKRIEFELFSQDALRHLQAQQLFDDLMQDDRLRRVIHGIQQTQLDPLNCLEDELSASDEELLKMKKKVEMALVTDRQFQDLADEDEATPRF